MPELPEVQVVINYLKQHILNKPIIKVEVLLKKLIKNIDPEIFTKKLVNKQFIDIKRKGKYLLFIFDDDSVMLSHLRMEGKYNYETEFKKQKHDHILYFFSDNSVLKYNDSRQFGTVEYFNNLQDAYNSASLKKLGLEPLSNEFNYEALYLKLQKSNKQLKTFLLDQSNIAGIGNIYANEICFLCELHPESNTKKLSKNDAKKLVAITKQILSDSIKHNGTTIHSFTFNKWSTGDYQKYLKVHQKKVCVNCNKPLIFKKINGRGTYFCSNCQKLKK